MKKIIDIIARILVGVLFIFSGVVKLIDPSGTAIKFKEYFEVFGTTFMDPMATSMAVLLSVLEVALGVALLLYYQMRVTAWALLLMIIFFSFLTFYSAYFNVVRDCGCFGDAITLTPWQTFTKDMVLLVLIGWVFYRRRELQPLLGERAGATLMLLVALSATGFAYYNLAYLPVVDFRPYKVGNNIPKMMKPSEKLQYVYIFEKDGERFKLNNYATDSTYNFVEMRIKNPEAKPKITDFSVWTDEADKTQALFDGNKLLIIMYLAEKADTANIDAINTLIQSVEKQSIQVKPVVLTASGREQIETFRHEHQLATPYYFADATVLKTMIRANPGLMLLQNGMIKGKWHHNDVPPVEKIKEMLKQ